MTKFIPLISLIILFSSCRQQQLVEPTIIDIAGPHIVDTSKIWLSHEHILVDFIGADSINPADWNRDAVVQTILPYLSAITKQGVDYFVDATPNYLGRDVVLLEQLAKETGLKIMTNTGLYGARNNQHIPQFALNKTPEGLAKMWIEEFQFGINQTTIKPGFIKIGVDNQNPLESIDAKLVKAAAITHLETGLTIASHTGKAAAMWPQLAILQQMDVAPNAFIWVHAQNESNHEEYVKAAKMGCWISLDGFGWETENHIEKLLFAKEKGILDHILIAHDAGWFDPQRQQQTIKPYTNIFDTVIPQLYELGFSTQEINMLIKYNPAKAFAIEVRRNSLAFEED